MTTSKAVTVTGKPPLLTKEEMYYVAGGQLYWTAQMVQLEVLFQMPWGIGWELTQGALGSNTVLSKKEEKRLVRVDNQVLEVSCSKNDLLFLAWERARMADPALRLGAPTLGTAVARPPDSKMAHTKVYMAGARAKVSTKIGAGAVTTLATVGASAGASVKTGAKARKDAGLQNGPSSSALLPATARGSLWGASMTLNRALRTSGTVWQELNSLIMARKNEVPLNARANTKTSSILFVFCELAESVLMSFASLVY